MATTSFDLPFDFTFLGIANLPNVPIDLSPTGGLSQSDGLTGVPGAVLPFSDNPATLDSCATAAQGWEQFVGVPQANPFQILPFILVVNRPLDLTGDPASVYCNDSIDIINVETGVTTRTVSANLRQLTDGTLLYVQHTGTTMTTALPDGYYRLKVGNAYSAIFAVKCTGCRLKIRMKNPTRIGNLLYGYNNWEQNFYAQGELTGPIYEETESKSGDTRQSISVKKYWLLELPNVSESIADALSLIKLHRDFYVEILSPTGAIVRQIVADSYEASTTITALSSGGLSATVKIPVAEITWSATGATACATDVQTGPMLLLTCGDTNPVVMP